jgi:hypothetical protein
VATLLLLTAPLLGSPPALAGTITASSIWNKANALEKARQQMPAGSTVTAEHCQEVEVGMGNFRYPCTVEYSTTPAGPADTQPTP